MTNTDFQLIILQDYVPPVSYVYSTSHPQLGKLENFSPTCWEWNKSTKLQLLKSFVKMCDKRAVEMPTWGLLRQIQCTSGGNWKG